MKKLVSVLLVALLVFACIGCANQQAPANQPGDTATTAPDTSAPSAPADQTATPGVAVRESLVRMSHDSTPNLDPGAHIATVALVASCNLYETLIFPTEEGYDPFLAESWEISDDGMEYTFKIKEGVLFHDGSELTASDVAFSANRFITIGEGYAFVYTSVLERAEAIDDYHVKFILKVPFGPFLSSLGRLYIMNEEEVMAHAKPDGPYGEFGDYGKEWMLTHDAGSGPYKAVEVVQQDYFLAEKFKDWHMGWEDRPNAPEKFMLVVGTEAATVRTMMETQALEISDMWQSSESYATLESLDGVSLASYSTRMMQNVYFNNSIAPTDDVNVRKALACLFDYDTLLNVIFPGSQLCNGPVSKRTAGYAEATRYPYDIEKAKEYIAMSKYADTIGDYTLTFMTVEGAGTHEKIALGVQAAAKQAGINIEVTKMAWVGTQEAITKVETTPHIMTLACSPAFNEAGSALEAQFHSKTQGTAENCNWMGGIIDKEIEDAMTTLDQAERFKKYADIQKKVTDEICPCVWVADITERVAYQDTYISLPMVEAGRITSNIMGNTFYMPDIKIYTDR